MCQCVTQAGLDLHASQNWGNVVSEASVLLPVMGVVIVEDIPSFDAPAVGMKEINGC